MGQIPAAAPRDGASLILKLQEDRWDAGSGIEQRSADRRMDRPSGDASFFRVRFDRSTPVEKNYLRAMATLGPGPHRSGDIAEELGRKVNSLGPARSALIAKGMVYSPDHGDTAFTVLLFDQFMKRMMPAGGR